MFHSSRKHVSGIGLAVVLAIVALLAPTIALAATITVDSIPGDGWVNSPDNTGGGSVAIVESPEAGLGSDSVALTTAADADFAGIARVIAAPLSDLTSGSWMTYVPGPGADNQAASLRFGMYRLGGTDEFTTMVVERLYNTTVTPDVWETTTLDAETKVWQTTDDAGFCTAAALCTFAEFKEKYPDAVLLGLTVALGSGVPATTSYVDGITFTADGATDTWDFELAAPPPPESNGGGGGGGGSTVTVPPTDAVMPGTTPSSIRGQEALVVLGVLLAVVIVATSWRPARRRG
jgi:hypothetical protein